MLQDSEPLSPFPVVPIHQVHPRPKEQRWLIQELFLSCSVGLLGGPPKAFKTWLAAELALAVASGSPALGRFPCCEPGPVLFFGAEDPPPDLRTRFETIARARCLELTTLPLLLLDIAQLHLDDPRDLDRLHRTLSLHSPRLLVLDPFVRLVRTLDENSAREVSTVLGALRTLQRDHSVSVLLVHHMRKSPAAHPSEQLRGSGDFSAWADSGLYLTRQRDQRVLVVEHRSASAPAPLHLRLVAGDSPHLAICEPDCDNNAQGPLLTTAEPLDAQVLDSLRLVRTPQTTVEIRATLRVRKARLLDSLGRLQQQGLLFRNEVGWSLASTSNPPQGINHDCP